MAEEAFHATPSDVEISEAIVALKKLAEQPEETSEAGGGDDWRRPSWEQDVLLIKSSDAC